MEKRESIEVIFMEQEEKAETPTLRFGVREIDNLIGEVKLPCCILLYGDPGVGKRILALQALKTNLERGLRGILFASSRPFEMTLRDAKLLGWDLESYWKDGQLVVVDGFSYLLGDRAIRESRADYVIEDLGDLFNLGRSIVKILSEIDGPAMLVHDSLTATLQMIEDKEGFLKLARRTKALFFERNVAALHFMVDRAHDTRFVEMLKSMMEILVEMRFEESRGRFERWMRIVANIGVPKATGKIYFDVTRRGIEVLSV